MDETEPTQGEPTNQHQHQQDAHRAEQRAAVPTPAQPEPFRAGQLVLHLGFPHPGRNPDRLVRSGDRRFVGG
ncbi:hypothetical protein [Micromonospora sp. HUAS LYJ1]|uniref:hypothetical protein n=1 Tax=Micromonospora sp. HUAS LYJ1 TaxID=3061626 RepID=UPI002672EBAE|nr:hypothetical protein [Micromonospora sp. HUAS LYJ1]WKU04718.1 hypothetical protein Q2K16_28690 [Micromonospora sp. HUAS LYJ1]